MLDETQVARLAAAANSLRPDWPLRSLQSFIANRLVARAYRDVALALTWIATDPKTETPARVLEAGPWWKATNTERETPRPPRKAEECPIHAGNWRDNCHGCASDRLADTDTTPPELRRPDRENHLARVRAELAATRARLCGHGVERTRAKCADCDKPETKTEATEETK